MPMVDDQMWWPTSQTANVPHSDPLVIHVGRRDLTVCAGEIPTHPCGCVRGTSETCAVHAGGPGVFDVAQVTGWVPPAPPRGEIHMAPEVEARMVEAIARRVAELLKAG